MTVLANKPGRTGRPWRLGADAPSGDLRARRPVDIAAGVISALVVAALAWAHEGGDSFDVRVYEFLQPGLPGWLDTLLAGAFVAVGLYALGLVIGVASAHGARSANTRDVVVAGVIAAIAAAMLGKAVSGRFPDALPVLSDRASYPPYPVLLVAVVTAVTRAAGPFLSVPWRTRSTRLLALMALAAVLLVYGTVSSTVGAVAVGVLAASLVQVALGSTLGVPDGDQVRAALAGIGLTVDTIDYLDARGTTATVVRAQSPEHGDLLVKVYGRDSADWALASRIWRAVWSKTDGLPINTSHQQLAEHDSLMLLTAERAACPTPQVVAWGHASAGDSVIAVRWPTGEQLSAVDPATVADATLDAMWRSLAQLHEAGISHGAIEPGRVIVQGEATSFIHFEQAHKSTAADAFRRDRAQSLIVSAAIAGDERAIESARRNLGDEQVADFLPMLQPAALSRGLREDAKETGIKVSRLRSATAAALGVSRPELVPLQRVSWGSVLMAVSTVFAAYSLITSLVDIGLGTIKDQLINASWAWVTVAFVLAQLTNIGEYVSLEGVMGRDVPFGPTFVFRYALSFISLAVPSDAGTIAMNIRYQQKLGVPAIAAVAQGPLLLVVGKTFDILLLLLTAKSVGADIDTDRIDFDSVIRLVVIVVVVAVVAAAVVVAIPKLRARMLPQVKTGFQAVSGSLTDPSRLFRLLAGTLGAKLLFALSLASSATAFGASLSLVQALFVNSAVTLFVGLMPVPGGIGVAEASFTAALITVGVPEEAAVATAITHRMITAYIPPVFGWFASRWLTARDYL